MKQSKEQIIKDIKKQTIGYRYSSWYIGITNDLDRRISEHQREFGFKIEKFYWESNSYPIANEIENYFIEQGFQGSQGGGNTTSNIVYIFYLGNTRK